ncbi:MAG TPA: C13 family peptidase [Burkholderiaceae bacterium]|nr:C13 family peptidase [Burkholderiaceae bacterium]
MNPPDSRDAPDLPEHDKPAAPAARAPESFARDTKAQTPAAPRTPQSPGALTNLRKNLASGFALALLRSRAPQSLCASGTQLVLLFVLNLLLGAAYDLYSVGWSAGHFDITALPAASFWALPLLLSAGMVAALRADAALVLPLATAGFSLTCWGSVAAGLLAWSADHWPAVDRQYSALAWIPPIWIALAYAICAIRLNAVVAPRRRTVIVVLAMLLVLLPQVTVDPASRLWSPQPGAEGEAAAGAEAPQSEQTFYSQIGLLEDALEAITPGQAGVTELFTISFGGDGTQDVFLREAVGADSVMAEVFDSGVHSLVLANSQAHPQEQPFATVSALQRALATVAERMNGDEDVLALFLTSHGTADHHLVVSLPPYDFEDLTPERLRDLLDEADIRYRVIIVSACYSGAFIAPLAGPDTMVITASSADRESFGCRDGAQWTEFGRAYFAEALQQAASFEGAFRIASRRIAEREAEQGLAPSMPQISVGQGIREHLLRLETRRGGRILFASRTRERRIR